MRKETMKKRAGFTLVELIIASAMFSFMLVAAVGGLVNVMTIYTGAKTSRDNQQATRSIIEEIGRRANFASNIVLLESTTVCIKVSNLAPTIFFLSSNAIYRSELATSTDCSGTGYQSAELSPAKSSPAKARISPSNIEVTNFAPQVITNVHDPSTDPSAVDSISLNLKLEVQSVAVATFVGPNGGQQYRNKFATEVAFFALNQ